MDGTLARLFKSINQMMAGALMGDADYTFSEFFLCIIVLNKAQLNSILYMLGSISIESDSFQSSSGTHSYTRALPLIMYARFFQF